MGNNLVKITSAADVRQTAIRLLARREHSRLELQQKLQQRDYPLDLIHAQLDQLIQQGLLSEERFAENYVRARSDKGYGPLRIMNELQQRGVSAELIDSFIDPDASVWSLLAEQVRQKRFAKKIPKDFSERAKQMRFLQYRGFGMEQINKVMNELLD